MDWKLMFPQRRMILQMPVQKKRSGWYGNIWNLSLIHICHGAYFMTETEQKQLTAFLGLEKGTGLPDKEFIGKTAAWLAQKAGFAVPEHTKVLVSEQSYITDFNPYAKGLLCPVLAFYIEEDWIHACEKCIELLVGESRGNTLTIHSQDPEVIRQFALKKPVGRVLINTPAVWGAMGVTTDLFPTVIDVYKRQGMRRQKRLTGKPRRYTPLF